MSMACEYAQLFTAKQPQQNLKLLRRKKKTKKKQKKAMEISTPMRDTSELPSNAFHRLIGSLKTGTDSSNFFYGFRRTPYSTSS
jgi:hypothetical protein